MAEIRLTRLSMWMLFAGAVLATAAAVAAWFVPVDSFDSSCSLATRNLYDNDGACADVYRRQWVLFVGSVVAAIVLAVVGAVLASRRRWPGRRGSANAP